MTSGIETVDLKRVHFPESPTMQARRPGCFLTDLSSALAVPSLWEMFDQPIGFLVSGGEAAPARGQSPGQHLGAATNSLTGPQTLHPQ